MIEHALHYAARNWAVFPLYEITNGVCACGKANCGRNAGKHPRIKGSFKAASVKSADIERWWKKWPSANLGLATGAKSGVTIVDIDGAEGWTKLQALAAGRLLPDTLAARTGSGVHLFFCYSGEISSARDKLDVRGDNGYAVLAPSVHRNGNQYQWLNNNSLHELPSWLKEYAQVGAPARESSVPVVPIPDYLKPYQQYSVGIASKVAMILRKVWAPTDIEDVRGALQVLDPAIKNDPWVKVGMALHSLNWESSDGSDIGLELWDQWSAPAPNYRGRDDLETRWRSFRREPGPKAVGLGTLFDMARKAGWIREQVPKALETPCVPESLAAAVQPASPASAEVNGQASASPAFSLLPATLTAPQRPIRWVDVDKAGNAKATCANARVAIRRFGLECRHDVFHDRFSIAGANIAEFAGELTDNAVHILRSMIHRSFGWDPGTLGAYDAAVQECLEHRYDPVQDYLDALQWDRRGRLATWLQDYLGAEATKLNQAFGLLTMVAAVRRTRQPGAKFDQIIVLEGPEGTNKSTAIEVLAEAAGAGNYSDSTILTLDDRGQQEAVQGVWLYEIADLAGISKAEVERVKAFASRRVDRARPAYGRSRQDRPRRCVFFATTNHDTYLKSQTGDRRFWPVRTGHIDVERLTADRDQLWAEAAAIERTGIGLTLPPMYWVEAAEVQAARRDADPWDDILTHVLGKEHPGIKGPEFRITSRDLFDLHLRLPNERLNDASAKRLAYSMRRLGWVGPAIFWADGKATRGYSRVAPLNRSKE